MLSRSIIVALAACWGSAAAAQSTLSDFYRTCLAAGGQPTRVATTTNPATYQGSREMLISVTVAPNAAGKFTVSRENTFPDGASGIIIGANAMIAFTGTRLKVLLREGEGGELCVRIAPPV